MSSFDCVVAERHYPGKSGLARTRRARNNHGIGVSCLRADSEATMTTSIRAFVGLSLAIGLAGAASAAAKPDGGMCACGIPMETPVLCGSLAGSARDTCIASNSKWSDACVAWREQMCHAPLSPAPVKLVGRSPSLPKFVGSWSGKTVCRKLGTTRLVMSVAQHDGSFVAKASRDGAGEFTEIAFKENQMILVYSSLFRDTSYTGRLTSPDRIEGAVRIGTEHCSWYLVK
jgi:hypothetical protein